MLHINTKEYILQFFLHSQRDFFFFLMLIKLIENIELFGHFSIICLGRLHIDWEIILLNQFMNTPV